MSIIDSTYFEGEILLTNKTDLSTDITQAINQYEKEILISLLGYELYKLVDSTPNIEPYKSLIEGDEFDLTFDGITQTLKWEGLKNSAKESLIAGYVYYNYMHRNYIKPGAVGTIKPKSENSEIVSPYPKMVQAWNKMIFLYGETPHWWFLYNSAKIIKPDGNTIFNNAPSAYNYICANIDNFPEWIFTPLRPINIFGI